MQCSRVFKPSLLSPIHAERACSDHFRVRPFSGGLPIPADRAAVTATCSAPRLIRNQERGKGATDRLRQASFPPFLQMRKGGVGAPDRR
jgi:hypothetical protein